MAKIKTETSENTRTKRKIFSISNVCFALAAILIVACVLVVLSTIRNGADYAREAYEEAKEDAAEEAYQKFYDTAFVSAERKYHVSNDVAIDVSAVREKADLEVLKVSDVEYVIENKEDNTEGIEAWLEFYGEGVYTVDLKASEFIIDSDRQYILVRVPRPELNNCKITETNRLLYEGGIFNKSVREGTNLAEDMRKAGYTKLSNYMKSNAKFYDNAKKSATTVIADLVKGLNPELPNLVVEVEFVDMDE